MRRLIHLVLISLFILGSRGASADVDRARKAPDEVQFDFGGLVQIQTDTAVAPPEPPWRIRVRRARPYAEITVGDWFLGRIEPDFSTSSFFLNDAYVRLQADPRFAVLLGRSGRPFDVVDAIGTRDLVPIERGARLRGIKALDHYVLLEEVAYVGRSFGVTAEGKFEEAAGFQYKIGYYQGGIGEENDQGGNVGQFAGRVSVKPASRLQFGASATHREFPCPDCKGQQAQWGTAAGADILYGNVEKLGPLALLSASGGVLDAFQGTHFVSGQLWLAYRFKIDSGPFVDAQPLLRVSHGRPEGERARYGGTLITPGLNLYMGGKNKLMFDLDLWVPNESGPVLSSLKTQLQLAF